MCGKRQTCVRSRPGAECSRGQCRQGRGACASPRTRKCDLDLGIPCQTSRGPREGHCHEGARPLSQGLCKPTRLTMIKLRGERAEDVVVARGCGISGDGRVVDHDRATDLQIEPATDARAGESGGATLPGKTVPAVPPGVPPVPAWPVPAAPPAPPAPALAWLAVTSFRSLLTVWCPFAPNRGLMVSTPPGRLSTPPPRPFPPSPP